MTPDPSDISSSSDVELVSRMAAGDREAFAALFRRHQRAVFRFALQMTGSRETAEDVSQEVFMALARGGNRYAPRLGALSTYLYGVARHLVLQREKRRRSRREIELHALEDRQAPLVLADPIERLVLAEKLAALRVAILRLPPRYREVIVLCELHARSYEDAATIVGCPVGTIRSRLSRARHLLAQKCRTSLSAPTASEQSTIWLLSGRPRIVGPES